MHVLSLFTNIKQVKREKKSGISLHKRSDAQTIILVNLKNFL